MQSIVTLANDIPWIMAPASLIGSLVAISVISAVIQNTQQAFKLATVSIMTMLTMAALMMHIIVN
jgi:hypothetical protein